MTLLAVFSHMLFTLFTQKVCCCRGNFLEVKNITDKIFSFMLLTKGCNVLMYISLTP